METVYDVIIAGGGIAGLYAARELSKNNLKVLLIDQVSSLGSTAWTPSITVEKFLLPKEGINVSFNKVIFGTLKKEKKWISEQNIGYVLDYKRMCGLLIDQAKKNGCTVFTESTVDSLIKKNEEIVGVKTSKGDFYGKYIIDATGAAGVLVSQVGLRKRVPCPPSVGIEIEVLDTNQYLKKYQDSIAVFFDTKLFPCGYGWISTNGQYKYKIGLCEFEESSIKKFPNLESRLEDFTKWLLGVNKVEILEKHGGSIYVGPKFKVKNILLGNLLGVGDSIGSINPFLGEGIRNALYSADFAVKSILNKINNRQDLNSYKKMWKKYTGLRWVTTGFISYALYEKNSQATQDFYDNLIEFSQSLNFNEILQLSEQYNVLPLIKKFPQNIRVILSMLKARFFNFS